MRTNTPTEVDITECFWQVYNTTATPSDKCKTLRTTPRSDELRY